MQQGEVFGYLGPNGAGKTTTIRLLLGLHRPTAGRAELFGVDTWHEPVAAHRRLAYVASEPYVWPGLTGAETLEFLGRLRDGTDRAYRTFVWELLGSLLEMPDWLLALSPFHDVGLVPGRPFEAGAAAIMLAIAACAGVAAVPVFERRDLVPA